MPTIDELGRRLKDVEFDLGDHMMNSGRSFAILQARVEALEQGKAPPKFTKDGTLRSRGHTAEGEQELNRDMYMIFDELDSLSQKVQNIEMGTSRVVQGPGHDIVATVDQGNDAPGLDIAEWIPSATGQSGIVHDPGTARSTPCLGYEVSPMRRLVFSQGVVGGLDNDQQALYCAEGIQMLPIGERLKERLNVYSNAADTCSVTVQPIPKGERLEPFLSCMSREIRNKGLTL